MLKLDLAVQTIAEHIWYTVYIQDIKQSQEVNNIKQPTVTAGIIDNLT